MTDGMIQLARPEIEVVVEIRVRARERDKFQMPSAVPRVVAPTHALVPPAPEGELPPSLRAGHHSRATANKQCADRLVPVLAVLIEGEVHYAAAFRAAR